MSHLPSTLVCQGCGHSVPPDEPYPFRCPNADRDDDIDHVLRRVLDISRLESPEALSRPFLSDLRSPFLRFGRLLHSYQIAHQKGLDDTSFAKLVTRIDAAVEAPGSSP